MSNIMSLPPEIQREIVDWFMHSLELTELKFMHDLTAVSPHWKALVRQSIDASTNRLCRSCSCSACQSTSKHKRTIRDIKAAQLDRERIVCETMAEYSDESPADHTRPHKRVRAVCAVPDIQP